MINKKFRAVCLFGGGYSVQIKTWYGWKYFKGRPYLATEERLRSFLKSVFSDLSKEQDCLYARPCISMKIQAQHEFGPEGDFYGDDAFANFPKPKDFFNY